MASIDLKPRIFLGPGPSNVHPRVLQALSLPLVGYLDPQVVELMEQIQAMLRYLFQTAELPDLPGLRHRQRWVWKPPCAISSSRATRFWYA